MLHNSKFSRALRARGQAIFPLVIILSFLLGLIGVTLAGAAYTQSLIAGERAFAEQARQAAQAGVDDALLRIARDKNWLPPDGGDAGSDPDPYTLTVGAQVATVTITDTSVQGSVLSPGVSDLASAGDSESNGGGDVGMALRPGTTNEMWMSFRYGAGPDPGNDCDDITADECSLYVAQYVGTGGNCLNAAWRCTRVDSQANDTGEFSSIGFNYDGTKAWVAYRDVTNLRIKVAECILPCGLGVGGTTCDVASGGSAAWNCTVVVDPVSGDVRDPHLAVNPNSAASYPWISYRQILPLATKGLYVAHYTGAAEATCAGGPASWDCEWVDAGGADDTADIRTTIAFDHAVVPKPWVVYFGSGLGSNTLYVATRGGSGIPGCSDDPEWACSFIGAYSLTHDAGSRWPSIAFDGTGNCGGGGCPWVSYWLECHSTSGCSGAEQARPRDLYVASRDPAFVARVGACPQGNPPGDWGCERVDGDDIPPLPPPDNDSDAREGDVNDIAIHPVTNLPWVAYRRCNIDPCSGAGHIEEMWLAVYRGATGGNCNDPPLHVQGSDYWDCIKFDGTATLWSGSTNSIAFDAFNNAWAVSGSYDTFAVSSRIRWTRCGDILSGCTTIQVGTGKIRRTIEAFSIVRDVQRKLKVQVEVSGSGGVQIISREELTS